MPLGQLALVPRVHALEQRMDRHLLVAHHAATAFKAREVEQVADDPLEAMRLLVDDVKVAVAR